MGGKMERRDSTHFPCVCVCMHAHGGVLWIFPVVALQAAAWIVSRLCLHPCSLLGGKLCSIFCPFAEQACVASCRIVRVLQTWMEAFVRNVICKFFRCSETCLFLRHLLQDTSYRF